MNKKIKKALIYGFLAIVNLFKIPLLICLIIILLICYITDIFYIGVKNEDKSNMKNEMKYYTTAEYTKEDTKTFFESVGDFLSGLFVEVIEDEDFPVQGKSRKDITSFFGYRNSPTVGASTYHGGIDIAAKEGTKLIAIMEGTVIKASWGGSGGYTITIDSNEYTITYCHCDPNFLVKVGDKVKKGQVIGKVGPKNVYDVPGNPYKDSNGNPTNGATTGSHCHFAVRQYGQAIDPLTILEK